MILLEDGVRRPVCVAFADIIAGKSLVLDQPGGGVLSRLLRARQIDQFGRLVWRVRGVRRDVDTGLGRLEW